MKRGDWLVEAWAYNNRLESTSISAGTGGGSQRRLQPSVYSFKILRGRKKIAALALLGSLYIPVISADGDANQAPAALLGKWRITALLDTTNIRPTSAAEGGKFIGGTLSFTNTTAGRGHGALAEVQYRVRGLTKDEFQQEFRTPWRQLGFDAARLTVVEVFEKRTQRRWEGLGSSVLISNRSAPIVYYSGSYYKLARLPNKE